VDLGTLLIRCAVGPMLFVHGWNKVLGSGGLAGTTRWFHGLGLRPAWMHARAAAASELVAGVLMTAGLATGLAATVFVGLMLVATLTDHRGKGYFVFQGGWEYTVLVAVVAVGVAALGPGRWSADHALGLDVAGAEWALASVVVGGLAAAALLVLSGRPQVNS
jgi:putative oxidoreductase